MHLKIKTTSYYIVMKKKLRAEIVITYKENQYESRKLNCGKYGYVYVAKENLWLALREGIYNEDYIASEIDEGIAYYCTDNEFELPDQELYHLIYNLNT